MKAIQKGFTLIELMIVVAIVGILAAIALPAYQEYIARSRMSEVLAYLDSAKLSVSEYVASNPGLPGNAATAGIALPGNATHFNAVYYNESSAGNGTVRVSAQVTGVNSAIDGDEVCMVGTIQADRSITWACRTTEGAGGAGMKYLPSNCRVNDANCPTS